MSSDTALQNEPEPIEACTIARDIQTFDLLIEDMEGELGERWGDLGFDDGLEFLSEPDARSLKFIAIAVDEQDEGEFSTIGQIITAAKKAQVKVILIADDLSPTALHQLLRLGADDFVPYPLPENALHDAIERQMKAAAAPTMLLDREGGSKALAGGDRDGAVLAVHGMAGGVGATTFAVNLAWELATHDKKDAPRVCLLDLDLQFGSVSTYLDFARRESVYELLADTSALDAEALNQAMQPFNDKLHVLTSPYESLPLDFLGPEDVTRIIDQARRSFDFVVIDMPSTLVQWSETVLHAAHVYFAVVELDMRSAQNALRFIRALKAEDLPFEKVRYALNRAPKLTDLTGKSRVKRMAESLDIDLGLQLPDGGKPVLNSCDHGLPLAEMAAKNPLRKEMMKLAKSLLELNAAEEAA
ncbi:pilus assembly protein CpaE [Maritimibacter sp. 55A14]|uniref:AAA family ATPase n=1 Tax=Maritimibacter sp. 55A14 TaxID=2174844 RepID=UPI000D6058BB|nr:AAA family ATPase [Maritimibacter sp. 55A14]PWE31984.1 pilus assembly protein CpaE [Maritimibacter sp. 55A14]